MKRSSLQTLWSVENNELFQMNTVDEEVNNNYSFIKLKDKKKCCYKFLQEVGNIYALKQKMEKDDFVTE